MKNFICVLLLVMFNFSIEAQEVEKILDRYLEVRENTKEYQSNVTYKLVKDNNYSQPLEEFSGVEGKWNGIFYQEIKDTKMVYGEDFSVKLNSEEKAMLVGLSSQNISPVLAGFEAAVFFKFFNEVTLDIQEENFIISFSGPTVQEVSEFKKVELSIDKKTFRLKKQVFHYANATDFSVYNGIGGVPDIGMAKLIIEYDEYREEVLLDKELFKKDYYFHFDGNKITASNRYKKYELLYAR